MRAGAITRKVGWPRCVLFAVFNLRIIFQQEIQILGSFKQNYLSYLSILSFGTFEDLEDHGDDMFLPQDVVLVRCRRLQDLPVQNTANSFSTLISLLNPPSKMTQLS